MAAHVPRPTRKQVADALGMHRLTPEAFDAMNVEGKPPVKFIYRQVDDRDIVEYQLTPAEVILTDHHPIIEPDSVAARAIEAARENINDPGHLMMTVVMTEDRAKISVCAIWIRSGSEYDVPVWVDWRTKRP